MYFPDDFSGVCQPVLDLQDPERLRDAADARLLFIDDQSVFLGNAPETIQELLQEVSALMNSMKIVGVTAVTLHTFDYLRIVVYPVWVNDPDVLRRLGADVHALPQHLLTGEQSRIDAEIHHRVDFSLIEFRNLLIREAGDVQLESLQDLPEQLLGCQDLIRL